MSNSFSISITRIMPLLPLYHCTGHYTQSGEVIVHLQTEHSRSKLETGRSRTEDSCLMINLGGTRV